MPARQRPGVCQKDVRRHRQSKQSKEAHKTRHGDPSSSADAQRDNGRIYPRPKQPVDTENQNRQRFWPERIGAALNECVTGPHP